VTGILRYRAVRIITGLLLLGTFPSLLWAVRPDSSPPVGRTPDPRYATQSGSSLAAREQHVRNRGDEDVDSAVEACAGMGIALLAAKYDVPARPRLVARRFAGHYESAYSRDAYRGCLHGLRHGG
jgi:hypothetical protein